MSIIVNLACGLANRMFQYSYYLYLREKGYSVLTDTYNSGKLAHEYVNWNRIFPKAKLAPALRSEVLLMGGGNDMFSRFRRKYLFSSTRVQQMTTAFDVQLPRSNSSYVIGCFQNAKMVESVATEVNTAFSFTPLVDDYNKAIADKMQQCDSVAIHVRKGSDYQKRIWYQDTCHVEYYQKAITYMRNCLSNPRFYVFADNKEWVEENLTDFDFELIDGNPNAGYGNHLDMQLMSMCRHNIMSNSTYSWWATFLNRSKGKKVIMPKIWFNPNSCEEYYSDKLCCKGWVQI